MGVVGGAIWHGIKGARNSPRVSLHPLIPYHAFGEYSIYTSCLPF
jgi:hypothetical protein